ncbi:hypothetical protein [Dictyobacter arantiisoli]|uniref:Uncharacterized protein n=1 Tax=Dictyobacter arantiisoli TaxID=2014874 RepID=A0A5A5T968_9CHLR|nr:hypothetical protein [Dictyobacter arantiisoli]GCF07815.1 hypothetical protein KDI_13790 [Dictyobacter arantiisoli]
MAQQVLKKASYMVCIGNAAVTTYDKQFFDGAKRGYSEYTQNYRGKILTERDIYLIIMQIVDVKHSENYQAGIIAGWMAAMFETNPTECKLIKMSQE